MHVGFLLLVVGVPVPRLQCQAAGISGPRCRVAVFPLSALAEGLCESEVRNRCMSRLRVHIQVRDCAPGLACNLLRFLVLGHV